MPEFPTDVLSFAPEWEAEIETTNGTCWVDYEVNSGSFSSQTM
jgi:hypothetical protein